MPDPDESSGCLIGPHPDLRQGIYLGDDIGFLEYARTISEPCSPGDVKVVWKSGFNTGPIFDKNVYSRFPKLLALSWRNSDATLSREGLTWNSNRSRQTASVSR